MMKTIYRFFLLLLLTSCNTTTADDSDNNNAVTGQYRRNYDPLIGSVQIVAIQADQSNPKDDVWIVLQTDHRTGLSGWYINAGDVRQDYALRGFIDDSLIIYTRTDPDISNPRDTGLSLSAGKWIWNNIEPDTAWLYYSAHSKVDMFTYKK